MSMKRKNKGSGVGQVNADWYVANVKRQKKRNKLAKQSRKKNR